MSELVSGPPVGAPQAAELWEGWPTATEAAAGLGVSLKTIERYADKGKLELRKRPRAGKKPENVVNPRDIERLKPQAHVLPASVNGVAEAEEVEAGIVPVPRPKAGLATLDPVLLGVIQTISTAIQTIQTNQSEDRKLWLSIREAARYLGIPRKSLRSMVLSGEMPARKFGGSWRIRRASLEAFAG